MAQYQRIFAALDGASTQEAVAQRAAALAADNGARLLFGHVIDSVPNEANGADFDAIPSVEVRVRAGRVAETLAEQLIEPFAPDLVVCGERGLSNIKYVFVGSVSTYLIRNLRCDVLVVKQA